MRKQIERDPNFALLVEQATRSARVSSAVPTFRGAAHTAQGVNARAWLLSGPAECVAGETRIYNPLTGQHTPIAELCAIGEPIPVLTVFGPCKAEAPFRKGTAALYRVTMESGRSFLATARHRMLTDQGWRFVSELCAGTVVPSSSPIPPASNSGAGLPGFPQDARHSYRIPQDYRGGYSAYFHLCDEQLLEAEDSDLTSVQQLTDALVHSHGDLDWDAWAFLSEHTHPDRLRARPSIFRSVPLSERKACTGSGAEVCTPAHNACLCQLRVLSQKNFSLQLPLFAEVQRAALQPIGALYSSIDAIAGRLNTVCEYYTTDSDTIASICYERTDEYFDMHVPGVEHYFAEGYWHHNTGKTYAGLYRLDTLARQYPDQYILARKVRVTMDSTVLNTWRRIIAIHGGVTAFGGEHPQFYTYSNGARVWVVGFDNPDKILSGEFGGAYVNQAEELEEDDFETLTTRVTGRGATNPNPMVFGDCNPGPEDHWIIGRRDSGRMTLLESKHEDNPTLHDGTGWTEQGERALSILDSLTGARFWRLRMGLWVGAEGQHFEAWDEQKHVIGRPYPQITGDWLIWGGLDYGFGHPFASGVLGLDPLGNTHIMGEWGGRKILIPDHVAGYLEMLAQLGIHPDRVRSIAAGHDAWATRGGDDTETIADKWARAVRVQLGHDALRLERAIVDRVNGATAIQEGLGNATRQPTLYIWEGCTETIKTIPRMVTDPKNPEDVKKINADAQGRGGDDYYDFARYGVMGRPVVPHPDADPYSGSYRSW